MSTFLAQTTTLTQDLVIKWSPHLPLELSGYYQRGHSLPARAFTGRSSHRIVFLCVFVFAVLPARALSFSIRTFVFPARALVVFFMIAVCPARALASGTQNSILPAWALTDVSAVLSDCYFTSAGAHVKAWICGFTSVAATDLFAHYFMCLGADKR